MPSVVLRYEGTFLGPNWPATTTAPADGRWSMTFEADGRVLRVCVEVAGTASIETGQAEADSAILSLTEAIATADAVAGNIVHLERPACVSVAVKDEKHP